MSTPIAVTLRDRIIAPVIEDIAEMERRVLVTMFTYSFIDLLIYLFLVFLARQSKSISSYRDNLLDEALFC